jgi:hypothetical protein
MLVLPGTYKVFMALYDKGEYKKLTEPVEFKVIRLNNTTLPAEDENALLAYQKDLNETIRIAYGVMNYSEELKKKLVNIKQTIVTEPNASEDLMAKVLKAEKDLKDVIFKIEGVSARASYEEIPPHKLPVGRRLQNLAWIHRGSTAGVTQTERDQLKIVKEELPELIKSLKNLGGVVVPGIEKELNEINANYTPGRFLDFD